MGDVVTSAADHLYGEAISALGLDPAVVEIFSPAAKALYDVGIGVVRAAVGDAVTQIGETVMSEATAALGPEVVSQLSGVAGQLGAAVGDAIPIVNLFLAAYNIASAIQDAYQAPLAERLNQFFLVGQVQGSGKDGLITAADLFAPSREAVAGPQWGAYTDRPRSVLGALLAATSEDNLGEVPYEAFPPTYPPEVEQLAAHAGIPLPAIHRWPGTDPMWMQAMVADTNLHHSPIIWDLASNPAWPWASSTTGQQGIPAPRRKLFRALRRAMGARGEDDGATLLPAYLDLMLAEWDAGHMTRELATNLLGNAFTDNDELGPSAMGIEQVAGMTAGQISIDKPGVIGFPKPKVDELVESLLQFLIGWRASREQLAAHLPHAAPRLAGLFKGGKFRAKRPVPRIVLGRTPKQQAALDAYAQALGLPPGSY